MGRILYCPAPGWNGPLPPIMEPSRNPTIHTLHLRNSIWRLRSPLTILSFSPPAHSGPAPLQTSDLSHSALDFILSLCSSWGGPMLFPQTAFKLFNDTHHHRTSCILQHSSKSCYHQQTVIEARLRCSEDVHSGVSAALYATFNPFFTL